MYQAPISHTAIRSDGVPIVVLLDGRSVTHEEFRSIRVSPQEYRDLIQRRCRPDLSDWDERTETWLDPTPDYPEEG